MEQSTIPALDHFWQNGFGGVVRTKKIDAENSFDVCRIRFMAFQVGLPGNPGTVHQDVYRRKLLEDIEHFFPTCHITDHGQEVFSENRSHLVQLRLVDVNTPYICFQASETRAESEPQPRGCSGYNDILRLPALVHHFTTCCRNQG